MDDQKSNSTEPELHDLKEQLATAQKMIRELEKDLVLQKSEIDAQKEIIESQRDVALRQRDEVAFQQKEITASFTYASRIQSALLTSEDQFDKNLRDYFILYKPRDIVSGDFYWMTSNESRIVLTAADATGHGVPGAFMSLMGMVFLNDIVESMGMDDPATVLEQMRMRITSAFGKEEGKDHINAGMDMSLISIDRETLELKYAGAFNPIAIIRDGELTELSANKMPIGYHPYLMEKHFKNHSWQLQTGDRIYLYSDGFIDQFGWRNNKKFMKKNFKELLVDIQNVPLRAQRVLLENSLNNWKGDLEQVDDIIVIGIEV